MKKTLSIILLVVMIAALLAGLASQVGAIVIPTVSGVTAPSTAFIGQTVQFSITTNEATTRLKIAKSDGTLITELSGTLGTTSWNTSLMSAYPGQVTYVITPGTDTDYFPVGEKTVLVTFITSVNTGTGSYIPGYSTGGTTTTTPSTGPVNFTDVTASYAWAKDAIYALAEDGVIKGTSATTFTPAANTSRADSIVLLMRALGIKTYISTYTFEDVAKDAYYYKEVLTAKSKGVFIDYNSDYFYPAKAVTRQDLCVFMYHSISAANLATPIVNTANLSKFKDSAKISAYARDGVSALVDMGIVKGDNLGNVNPLGNATRAEVAVMIYRLLQYLGRI